jgi:hypothetical protein
VKAIRFLSPLHASGLKRLALRNRIKVAHHFAVAMRLHNAGGKRICALPAAEMNLPIATSYAPQRGQSGLLIGEPVANERVCFAGNRPWPSIWKFIVVWFHLDWKRAINSNAESFDLCSESEHAAFSAGAV